MGYRGKTVEQERARDLRAQDSTYAEICAELGVSRSSVSLWVRDVAVDPRLLEGRRRNRNFGPRDRPPNRLQRAKQEQIERLAAESRYCLGMLSDRDLFVAGIALYAGEGAKRDGAVRFANSDPRMIALFLRWLRRFFDVDEARLRVRVYLHDGHDLDAANAFWTQLTGIPLSQFGKPYRAAADPTLRRNKHPFGCPSVGLSCATTHRRIMGLVHGLLSSTVLSPG